MDTDEAQGEAPVQPQLSLNVLAVTKSAQLQNGLKHGDYGRYRQYCARRLRSLYKAVKFLHGKTRYQKKKLDVPQVTDTRHLQIVLVSAERAWSHAMQLKQEAESEGAAHKRRHGLRRLNKAAFWGAELARLAAATADTRSALEAEAYASWMAGNLAMEKEADWQAALAAYSRAKKLWAELSRVGDPDSQALCGSMVDEVEPALRYCSYQISRAGGAPPDAAALAALSERAGGDSLLQSKLASLAAEAQSVQAASTSSFEWRGIKAGVSAEKIRLPLAAAAEAATALDNAMDTDEASLEALLPGFDKAINAYVEARGAARAAIKAAAAGVSSSSGAAGDSSEAELAELRSLETALSGRILEATLSRGEAAAANTAARLQAALQRQAAGKAAMAAAAAAGTKAAAKERPPAPQDLVRLYTHLGASAHELEELSSNIGGRAGEALAAAAAARAATYAAWRCYFAAHTALAAGERLDQAAGLFRRAQERAAAAAQAVQDLPKGEVAARAALPGLASLSSSADAYLLVAAAEAAAAGAAGAEGAAKSLEGLGLTAAAAAAAGGASGQQPHLADCLDAWESFAGPAGPGKGARLFQGPYGLAPIRPRPIMLDSAAGAITYPQVSHRFKRTQAESQGTFARLFGGWGS